MHVRLDEAEQAVEDADERTLAIARERWRVVTWRAEREHSDTWGQRNTLIVEAGGVLADALARTREATLIEGDAHTVEDAPQIEEKP
jgi:hypothetical protein